jgi:hypothetical protein
VSLLAVLTAALSAKGAPPSLTESLQPGATMLSGLLPGLVALAGGGSASHVATRCEAFSALRAAATAHTAALAATWGHPGLAAILPAAFAPSTAATAAAAAAPTAGAGAPGGEGVSGGGGGGGGETVEAGGDRLAQASARLLGDYLLAVGGGLGGDDEPVESSLGRQPAACAADTAAHADPHAAAAAAAAGENVAVLTPSELIALWGEVAGTHFPCMTAHSSPLVRAAGLNALAGLTAAALGGVSAPQRRVLIDTPHRLLKDEAVPAVRAAACRAIGALAALPQLGADGGESLEVSVHLLLRALKDSSKSVRLSASWSVANLCNAISLSAADTPNGRLNASSSESSGSRESAPIVAMSTLADLARCCVTAATQEGDKVRANAARALGYLVAAADFTTSDGGGGGGEGGGEGGAGGGGQGGGCGGGPEAPSAWLPEVIQALMSCLTTGNSKTQWNACHAMGALFRNRTTGAAAGTWSPLVVRMLLMIMRDTRNFKIRMHAAAALAEPASRAEFGNSYPDTVSILTCALESLEVDSAEARGYCEQALDRH